MSEVVIEATWAELTMGGLAGVMRSVSAQKRGRTQRHGLVNRVNYPAGQWSRDCDGAIAEGVVARYLGLYWTPVHDQGKLKREDGDIGPHLEVRSHDERRKGLILHEDDPDDSIFYAVLCESPLYTIRGWLWGHEGKRPERWETKKLPAPAFLIPCVELHTCEGGAEVPEWVWLLQRGRVIA